MVPWIKHFSIEDLQLLYASRMQAHVPFHNLRSRANFFQNTQPHVFSVQKGATSRDRAIFARTKQKFEPNAPKTN